MVVEFQTVIQVDYLLFHRIFNTFRLGVYLNIIAESCLAPAEVDPVYEDPVELLLSCKVKWDILFKRVAAGLKVIFLSLDKVGIL